MTWQERPNNQDEQSSRRGYRPFHHRVIITYMLMAVCVGVFLVQVVSGGDPMGGAMARGGVLEFGEGLAFREPWRWITFQYLHRDTLLLAINLLAMFFFMRMLEQRWGWKRTLTLYTMGGIAGGVATALCSVLLGQGLVIVGAGSSVLAAIGALTARTPAMHVMVIVLPMSMRMLAMICALLYTLLMVHNRDLTGLAQLGGMCFGAVAGHWGSPLWRRMVRRMRCYRIRRLQEIERDEGVMIDQILQKVSERGLQSLSYWERRALRRATERQRLAEISREHGG